MSLAMVRMKLDARSCTKRLNNLKLDFVSHVTFMWLKMLKLYYASHVA